MLFKERIKPTTTISIIDAVKPLIIIQDEALAKMQIYVSECADEIGWLGTAYKDEKNNIYIISDAYLFDQEVHSTTTEITPEGLSEFATELLSKPDGVEIWNNMRVWGHSHVNMAVNPSGQDNAQMETFAGCGLEWFIRIIANKTGELKIDLFDYTTGIAFIDVPWEREISDEEAKIEEQIAMMWKMIENKKAEKIKSIKELIEEEMKLKVRKKTYLSTAKYWDRTTGAWVYQTEPVVGFQSKIGSKNHLDKYNAYSSYEENYVNNYNYNSDYKNEVVFEQDEDVEAFFTINELEKLAEESNNIFDLEKNLIKLGHKENFSGHDLLKILKVARDTLEYFDLEDEDEKKAVLPK